MRLTKRSSERSREAFGACDGCDSASSREIQVVHGAAILKQIQQDHAGKPQPVFRSAFDLGLVLIVDLAFHDLLVFFQFGDAILGGLRLRRRGEEDARAGCAADSFAAGAEYGFSGPLAGGRALRFHEIQLAAKLARFRARALLFRAQVAQLRIERLHLGLEIANQVRERADFRRRFRRQTNRTRPRCATSCPCACAEHRNRTPASDENFQMIVSGSPCPACLPP